MAAIKALEQWCKSQCDGYRDVSITNMTTSFRNGMAFCALIHKYRPDLIDYDSLRKEDVFENNRLAFQIAEEKLGIPALLDAEDMVALRIPDRLSILTYVSQYYNYFRGRPPMGGVKRPAEGSREEPSEKKNLPVVAKTFLPKTAAEIPLRCALTATAKTSKAEAQKPVLADNANKGGTLNSKCVACKSHVHLVQRHFVEGRLFHRSCFKCSECSSLLHTGGYKPGKNQDTFICKSSCKPSSSEAAAKSGAAGRSGRNPPLPPRPASLLLAPVQQRKPVGPAPAPPSPSWTSSAQKTQVARQRFFQDAPAAPDAWADMRRSAELSGVSGWPHVQLSPNDERSRVRKPAEANGNNNNNKRLFTVRSAERRFGEEPRSTDWFRQDKCSQSPAGSWAGRPSTSPADNKESLRLKAESADDDDTGPRTAHTAAKDPVSAEARSDFKPKTYEQYIRDPVAVSSTEPQQNPAFESSSSSNVSDVTTRLSASPEPAAPPVSVPVFVPANFREVSARKPLPASGNPGFKNTGHSPAKSASRRPAAESLSFASTTEDGQEGHVAGAKKGKYLSHADASRTESRSQSLKSRHVPAEQIENELNEIEANLARLERDGVELEKKLRCCEEDGEGDILMDPLMVDWFKLIRKKQMFIRKESELVYIARTQELEQQQPGVEGELRRLLEKPDHLKSAEETRRETLLMQRLVEIVNGRNAIVEGLDEDRLREVEEDQQLNEMMKNLGVKKSKTKRKSSLSKLFRRRSKRRVE